MPRPDPTYRKITTSLQVKDPVKLTPLVVLALMDNRVGVVKVVDLEIQDPQGSQGPLGSLEPLAHLDLSLTFNLFWNRFKHHKVEKRVLHQTHFLTCRPKLDLLDQEDLQVCKDPMDHKVFKDLWENPETLDPQDPLDLQDQEAFQVSLEKMANLAETENLDQLDQMVHLEKEVYLECLVFLDQKDTVVSQV